LRDKFYETDSANGTPGMYITKDRGERKTVWIL
jgi:hypothetical protein